MMFRMCKTKYSSKDCNRCFFIVTKIDILCSSWRTREFINHYFEQVKKLFLVWNIYFTFFSRAVDCTFYKSTIKSNCVLLVLCHLRIRSSRLDVFCKKDILRNLAKSQENTCARVSFLKKRLWHRCFPVNFVKFLRTLFLTEHLRWLLLAFQSESTLHSFRLLVRNRSSVWNLSEQ